MGGHRGVQLATPRVRSWRSRPSQSAPRQLSSFKRPFHCAATTPSGPSRTSEGRQAAQIKLRGLIVPTSWFPDSQDMQKRSAIHWWESALVGMQSASLYYSKSGDYKGLTQFNPKHCNDTKPHPGVPDGPETAQWGCTQNQRLPISRFVWYFSSPP